MTLMPSASLAAADNPKFAPITHDDHGGVIAIIAALLMSGTLISLGIRIYVRISITKGVGVDDYVFTAASVITCPFCFSFIFALLQMRLIKFQVLAVGQTVAALISVNRGFGKRTYLIRDQTDQIPQLEKVQSLCFLVLLRLILLYLSLRRFS